MPRLAIDVSDDTAARLDVLTTDYNMANGTALTRAQYVALHLRELAIAKELLARVENLKQQSETDLRAATEAERIRLTTEA